MSYEEYDMTWQQLTMKTYANDNDRRSCDVQYTMKSFCPQIVSYTSGKTHGNRICTVYPKLHFQNRFRDCTKHATSDVYFQSKMARSVIHLWYISDYGYICHIRRLFFIAQQLISYMMRPVPVVYAIYRSSRQHSLLEGNEIISNEQNMALFPRAYVSKIHETTIGLINAR